VRERVGDGARVQHDPRGEVTDLHAFPERSPDEPVSYPPSDGPSHLGDPGLHGCAHHDPLILARHRSYRR
jgi:hypothetical protein